MMADGVIRCATFQAAPVRKPPMAVPAACDAGHLCLFDNDWSLFIQRDSPEEREIRRVAKRCVDKMTLERCNGVYILPTTIVPPKRLDRNARLRTRQSSPASSSTNMDVDAVFHRQGR